MFVDPKAVIESADIQPGMIVADFGAGAGFYSIPVAKRLSGEGKVYSFDIRKEMLEVIRSRARTSGIHNLETIWADLEKPGGSNLKDLSADIAIISNILFQVERKDNLVAEAFRILKPGGKAIVVEWTEDEKPLGPPLKERVNREEAEDIFVKSGFALKKEFDAGEHHYGIIFEKPTR